MPRRLLPAYRLYLLLACGISLLQAIAYTTVVVYWVDAGRLDPLQLLLLGTVLELTYFLFQLPTGVLADLVSRRLFVLAGLFVLGLAMVWQSLSPAFAVLLAAQVVAGVGYAMLDGALEAWIADELGGDDDRLTSIYLRATQLGLIAAVAGSLLSGLISLGGLELPLRVAGIGTCVLAAAAAVTMPERGFTPAGLQGETPALVVRQAGRQLAGQAGAARRAIIAVPGLLLLFVMTAFTGLWSESFDRLWGAFLLRDVGFPAIGGLRPALWFSLLACVVSVGSLGSTELARRRSERLGPDSVTGGLLAVTAGIGVAVVVMALAHSFALAIVAYLAVSVLRPVSAPLLTGWLAGRVDPSVRATALSAQSMFDSGGQIIGGPVIGVVGNLTSIRIALLAGASALIPAIACIAAASSAVRASPPQAPGCPTACANPRDDPRTPA